MSARGLLRQACAVERPVATIRSDGSVSLEYESVAGSVPCCLQRLRTEERLAPDGAAATATACLYVERGTDIRPAAGRSSGDRIALGGIRYFVVAVQDEIDPDSPVRTLYLRAAPSAE